MSNEPPRGVSVQELGARQGDEHDRRLADVAGQILEQLQLAASGPVDVVEHQESGRGEPRALDEAAGGEEEEPGLTAYVVVTQAEEEREVAKRVGRLGLR